VTCGILPWIVTLILVSNQLRLQSNLLSTSAAASQSKRKGKGETNSRTSKRTKLFQAETTKKIIPSSTGPKQGTGKFDRNNPRRNNPRRKRPEDSEGQELDGVDEDSNTKDSEHSRDKKS
jgi:hypothetical protein